MSLTSVTRPNRFPALSGRLLKGQRFRRFRSCFRLRVAGFTSAHPVASWIVYSHIVCNHTIAGCVGQTSSYSRHQRLSIHGHL